MSVQNRKEYPLIPLFLLVLLIIIFDQITKSLLRKFLPLGSSFAIIKNVLHLTHIHNLGAAFGIFKKGTFFFIFVSSLAIIFIAGMFFLDRRKKLIKGLRLRTALGFILAGAMGNLFDRLRFGYVIDFIDIRIWPVFNVADTFITLGAILLIYEMIFSN